MTIDAISVIENALHAAGKDPKRKGDGLTAKCPSHPDRTPSLSVTVGDVREAVIYCHAGCKQQDVMDALGLKWTDLGEGNPKDTPTTYWVYKDANGRTIYRVAKYPNKSFAQHAALPTGGWAGTLHGVKPVPYRLPELLAAIEAGDTIYIAEGEKDVDALVRAGVPASCNSGGADKFKDIHADWFKGANKVIIVADRDEIGVKHAETVAQLLEQRGVPSTIVQAAEGKDAYDHFAFGHGLDDFVPLDAPENDPTEEVWADPTPLAGMTEATPFPIHVFPEWIRRQVEVVADEMQCPPDLPAQLAITALSVAAAGHAKVLISGTWTEGLNTYLVTGLRPGENKSPNVKLMLGALSEFERELQDAADLQRGRIETDRKIITKQYNKAVEKGERTQAMSLQDELDALPSTTPPRILADDSTPEKMVDLLSQHGGRMAIVSTEGGVFTLMTGRYSDKSNLDPYLMAWSGDEIRVDRIGRDGAVVRDPCLTIGLTVQPAVIADLSKTPELRGRGLTARFMYSVPPSRVGYRDMRRITKIDEAVTGEYRRRLLELARRLHPVAPPMTLRLSDEAFALYVDWRQDLEPRRKPGGDLFVMSEWSIKLESTVARLAGLLHLADGAPDVEEISGDVMRRALEVGAYWETHARIAHELWLPDPVTQNAIKIINWAIESGRTEFTVRDAYCVDRRAMERADEAIEPLQLLIERGWIRMIGDEGLEVGRRGKPSPRVAVHPRASTLSGQVARMRTMRQDSESEDSLSLSISTGMDGRPRAHGSHARMTPVETDPVELCAHGAHDLPVDNPDLSQQTTDDPTAHYLDAGL